LIWVYWAEKIDYLFRLFIFFWSNTFWLPNIIITRCPLYLFIARAAPLRSAASLKKGCRYHRGYTQVLYFF
jgi:hypothetical protein